MKPVRVCFVIDELARAGTESQLVALLSRLGRSRVLPHLVLLRGEAPSPLEPAGCPVLRLGVKSLGSVRAAVAGLTFLRFLWDNRIDVVQAYFPDSTRFALPLAWLAGVPHRVRTRNNTGHWAGATDRLLGRVLNAFSTASVANCRAARRSLLADERVNPCRAHVLENGVDLERFLALEPPGGPALVVGAVANLRPVKGLDVLAEAAVRLQAACPDLRFRVAGEGEHRPALESRIARGGLTGRFQLAGACADVPTFLAGLDIAVLPSRSEGLSNSLLEYMAAARPIVATDVGANAEVLRDGVDGLIVPPDDAAALACAIGRLAQDTELSRRLALSARQRAAERYGRAAMVRRFEDFFVGLGATSPPNPLSGIEVGGPSASSPTPPRAERGDRKSEKSGGGEGDASLESIGPTREADTSPPCRRCSDGSPSPLRGGGWGVG